MITLRNLLTDCTIHQAGHPGCTFPWFGIRTRMETVGLNTEIVNVNQLDNGILVNFKDGVCVFFEAAFLYAQMEKRIPADFGDTPSGPLARGW